MTKDEKWRENYRPIQERIAEFCKERGDGFTLKLVHPAGGELDLFDRQLLQLIAIAESKAKDLAEIRSVFRKVMR